MTITDARLELEAALAAGGVRVASAAGSIGTPPCVVVVGAEPWLEPAQLGAGRSTVSLTAVGIVGGASDPVSMLELETMAVQLAGIIRGLETWTLPRVHQPGRTEVQGQMFSSVRVSCSRIIDT